MSEIGPLHTELEKLKEFAREATAAHGRSRYRQRREYHYAAREVVSDLAGLRDSILHRNPDAPKLEDRPAEERRLTVVLCKEIIKREDLVLFPLGNSDNLAVRDLSIDRDADASNKAALKARAAVKRFESDNAEALVDEQRRVESEKVKAAIDSGDADQIREALGVKG
jgi:hypothetical protein